MLQIAFIREKKEKAARLKTLVAKMNQQKNNEQTIETQARLILQDGF